MRNNTTILIVNKALEPIDELISILTDNGFNVSWTDSLSEAVKQMNAIGFDIVLSYIRTGSQNCPQFIQWSLSQKPDQTLIILADESSIDVTETAIKKGAFDYSLKPFDYIRLVHTINRALSRKKLLEENQTLNARLEESEQYHNNIIHTSPDLIFTLDDEDCFTFINSTFTKLLGYSSREIVGRSFYNLIHEKDHQKMGWFFHDRRETDPNANSPGVNIHLNCSPDSSLKGKHITVEMKKNSHPSALFKKEKAKPHIGGVCVTARDIGHRIELEEQLLRSQKMEAIGTMAGGIAHDFNNLLMSIQGHTSLMRSTTPKDHPHLSKLEAINKHITSGSTLTRQLLNFVRGDVDETTAENLNILIRGTVSMFFSPNNNINIHYDLEKKLWPVKINAGQMEQVILNLLVNARQAMPGGGDIYIQTRNVLLNKKRADDIDKKTGNYIKVSVKDTGCGIETAIQQKIFDPFFTTKGKDKGSGLGLATSYGIINNLNGTIEVESKKEEGATFILHLFSSFQERKDPRLKTDGNLKRKGRILIIDDEQSVIDVTREILNTIGYTIFTARTGTGGTAIHKKNSDDIDLIILGMAVSDPGVSETFEAIRQTDPHAKIVLSSRYPNQDAIDDLLRSGCSGFLQRPFTINKISKTINKILSKDQFNPGVG